MIGNRAKSICNTQHLNYKTVSFRYASIGRLLTLWSAYNLLNGNQNKQFASGVVYLIMDKERCKPKYDHPELRWIAKVSHLMDNQFRFPGTQFRFGLDPVLNLIPFAGDMAGVLVSGGLLLAMARKGASNKLVVLMSLNILLDATIGAIPILGQLFDFFFKANARNMKLMREHYLEDKHQGSGRSIIIWVLIILFMLLIALIYGAWKLAEWLGSLIT